MKKLFMILALLAMCAGLSLASDMAKKGSWTGWVSDAKCGAKFDAACAKKCIDAGQKPVLVTDSDKSVLEVANPDALKGHAGHHVEIKGTLDNNTLTVSQVTMLRDQSMK